MSDWESEGSDATPRRGEQWPSPTANAGTITMPTTISPAVPCITSRIAEVALALAGAARNVRAAQEWIERAQSLLRNGREQT